VESKLLQRETEMLHFQKDRKTILADREKLKCNAQDLIEDKKKLERQLERRQERVKVLSRELDERDALEQARKDRSSMVEKELRDARAMLVDASNTAVETETTTSALKETIQTLQQENQTLHGKIEEIQDRSRRNEERLQETLVKTERGAQSLRIKATAHDEHIQRVLSEKAGCEKQVTQLKTRVTNLERRLKESASFMSPAAKETVGGEPTTEKRRSRKSFQVPPLTPGSATTADKSPASASRKSSSCCLCFKSASGLMKTCQCGKPNCDKRAHSTCLAGVKSSMMSISHPGTPSPRLPVILCNSPLA
jgi:chromosome segregation ATPase